MENFREVRDMGKYTLDSNPKITRECPNGCATPMVRVGYRTADPWPEEEGPLIDVNAFRCNTCKKTYAFWKSE